MRQIPADPALLEILKWLAPPAAQPCCIEVPARLTQVKVRRLWIEQSDLPVRKRTGQSRQYLIGHS